VQRCPRQGRTVTAAGGIDSGVGNAATDGISTYALASSPDVAIAINDGMNTEGPATPSEAAPAVVVNSQAGPFSFSAGYTHSASCGIATVGRNYMLCEWRHLAGTTNFGNRPIPVTDHLRQKQSLVDAKWLATNALPFAAPTLQRLCVRSVNFIFHFLCSNLVGCQHIAGGTPLLLVVPPAIGDHADS